MAELVTGLSAGAAYALVAIGIVLIFKGTRALSFAQGEIGAFGLFLALHWDVRPLFLALVIAVAVGALLGLVVERVVMRPLVGRPPLDAVIATLGIALLLALLEKHWFGTATQWAPSPAASPSASSRRSSAVTPPRVVRTRSPCSCSSWGRSSSVPGGSWGPPVPSDVRRWAPVGVAVVLVAPAALLSDVRLSILYA